MRPEVLLPAWTRLAAARPLRSRIPPRRDGARALSSTPGGPPLQKKKPDLPPVFLVHGFRVLTKDTVDETSLSSMDAALVRRGYQNVHRFDYPSREDSLQNHAASLADFISRQLSPPEAAGAGGRGQLGPFGVVTHSFGGVVARAALNLLQVRGELPLDGAGVRVVMLAPPNKGCSLARALRPDAMVMLVPPNMGSSLARALRPDAVRACREAGSTSAPNASSAVLVALKANSMMAAAALNYAFDYFLGNKAGLELASGEEFPALPSCCEALVIAGSLGASHPLLSGITDGVVTEEETGLQTPHARMTLTAPHHLLPRHPSAIRATLAFLAADPVPGAIFVP